MNWQQNIANCSSALKILYLGSLANKQKTAWNRVASQLVLRMLVSLNFYRIPRNCHAMELLWVLRWDCQVVGTMTNVLWNLPAFALTLWFPIYPKPFQLTKCFAVYNLGVAMAKSSLNPQQPSEVGVVWSCWNSRGQQESLPGWFWKYHPPTASHDVTLPKWVVLPPGKSAIWKTRRFCCGSSQSWTCSWLTDVSGLQFTHL